MTASFYRLPLFYHKMTEKLMNSKVIGWSTYLMLCSFPSDMMIQSAFCSRSYHSLVEMDRLFFSGGWCKTAIWIWKKKVKAQGCSQCSWTNEFRRCSKAHYKCQPRWAESVQFYHHHMSPISSDAMSKVVLSRLQLLLGKEHLYSCWLIRSNNQDQSWTWHYNSKVRAPDSGPL